VLAASVCGTSHLKTGVPCQDACHHTILPDGTLVLAVADGAGSAQLAEVGASVAVRSAVEAVAARWGDMPDSCDADAWRVGLTEALHTTQEALAAEARSQDANLRDLASTLLLTVATADCIATLHLGDGAAVLQDMGDRCLALTTPQIGEYLNETSVITDPDAHDHARIAVHPGPVQYLCLLSDGLQMLALSMPQGTPHAPFFTPLFQFIDQMKDEATTQEQLTAFLTSPRITERTDDDVTLCLAVRG
jgi:hypothetical protein